MLDIDVEAEFKSADEREEVETADDDVMDDDVMDDDVMDDDLMDDDVMDDDVMDDDVMDVVPGNWSGFIAAKVSVVGCPQFIVPFG